jgi:hypothetical protein
MTKDAAVALMVCSVHMTHRRDQNSSNRFKKAYSWFAALATLATLLGGSACKAKGKATNVNSASPVESTTTKSSAANSSQVRARKPVVPSGPRFAIEAGGGLGPVRFGATVATIERLMDAKCDEITDKFCRYIPAGIEFELSKGVVSGIIIYRHDRAVTGSPGKTWGRTRCAIPPDITPRVIQTYVHSTLGKPQSSEEVTVANPNRTAIRETYPGLVIEYDRGEYTQELIVGSIRIVKTNGPPASR